MYNIAIFGEAERGKFKTAYFCNNLAQLDEFFGNPPPDSLGLYCAVQALLFKRNLIFIRVPEEGFSRDDYFTGFEMLEHQKLISHIDAICIPGVGDQEILSAVQPIGSLNNSLIIINESDFYDYLTTRKI